MPAITARKLILILVIVCLGAFASTRTQVAAFHTDGPVSVELEDTSKIRGPYRARPTDRSHHIANRANIDYALVPRLAGGTNYYASWDQGLEY